MDNLLEITFSSFWHFVGMVVLLSVAASFILSGWSHFLRMLNIRKHGWPPPHCDADGDTPFEASELSDDQDHQPNSQTHR